MKLQIPHWLQMLIGAVVIGGQWYVHQDAPQWDSAVTGLVALLVGMGLFSGSIRSGKPQSPGYVSVTALLSSLGFGGLVFCGLLRVSSCIQQAVPVVTPVGDCGGCVVPEAIAGKDLSTIWTDCKDRCGSDLEQVITALLSTTDPAAQKSKAYGQASHLKATLKAGQ